VAFCSTIDKSTSTTTVTTSVSDPVVTIPASFRTTGKLSRAKGFNVRVTCPAACSFTVKLGITAKVARKAKLGRKALTIGTAKGSLTAAGDKTVKLKLSRKARNKLRKLKTVPATLSVVVTDAGGKATTKKAVKLVR
jgi:hypothetical protein